MCFSVWHTKIEIRNHAAKIRLISWMHRRTFFSTNTFQHYRHWYPDELTHFSVCKWVYLHVEKSILKLIKSNQISNIITLFQMIRHLKEHKSIRLVQLQSPTEFQIKLYILNYRLLTTYYGLLVPSIQCAEQNILWILENKKYWYDVLWYSFRIFSLKKTENILLVNIKWYHFYI